MGKTLIFIFAISAGSPRPIFKCAKEHSAKGHSAKEHSAKGHSAKGHSAKGHSAIPPIIPGGESPG